MQDRLLKSLGSEETFDVDCRDRSFLESKVREQAENVGSRCRSSEIVAKTVTVKVRFGDFSMLTRARSLSASDAVPWKITATVCAAFMRDSRHSGESSGSRGTYAAPTFKTARSAMGNSSDRARHTPTVEFTDTP